MDSEDNAGAMLNYLILPAEFMKAEPWARRMYQELREHREQSDASIAALSAQIAKFEATLGTEPDSDGGGGNGLIGDVRKVIRDVHDLKNLKLMGTGFVSALTLFGALIFMGIGQWITGLLGTRR